ncbi:uncharacterized protein LOC121249463 [Juglans microcarpa x Juglans regia]|uniref:uncharacterized protein LOC121249463 n=1 Tax=Juglans microcarpa x Juglans regia TaxID=2249226 RepID=UPI001B7F43B9|nr:uncharacterized protein LOC121249463 [Juglans microcarpa x Juglans regia]
MEITPDRSRPAPTPLKGFTRDTIQPIGAITQSVLAGTTPKTTSLMVDFLVVKAPSSYNAILGRSSLNQMKAVTSTYHLKVKSPTPSGVGEIRSEQKTANDCYTQEMKSRAIDVQTLEEDHGRTVLPLPQVLTELDREVRDKKALQ